MTEPHLYPLGQGDHAPNAAYVDAAIADLKAELRAEMAERIGTLTEWVTWQLRDVDAIVEILRAEHRRRTGNRLAGTIRNAETM